MAAYYCAYHASLDFEEGLPYRSGIVVTKGGAHEQLIQRLERPSGDLKPELAKIGKYVAGRLRQFKAKRETASYHLNDTITIGDAEEALKMLDDILDELSRVKPHLG